MTSIHERAFPDCPDNGDHEHISTTGRWPIEDDEPIEAISLLRHILFGEITPDRLERARQLVAESGDWDSSIENPPGCICPMEFSGLGGRIHFVAHCPLHGAA